MKIQYLTMSLLQDYYISYMNENTISNQEPFTGLLHIICEYYYILKYFPSLIKYKKIFTALFSTYTIFNQILT